MARTTAPSLWLPGFDPDCPDQPDTLPLAEVELASPALPSPVDASSDDTEMPASAPRASWRVAPVAGPATAPARPLWPELTTAHLCDLRGTVTKFQANVQAIRLLQLLQAQDRAPTAVERD